MPHVRALLSRRVAVEGASSEGPKLPSEPDRYLAGEARRCSADYETSRFQRRGENRPRIRDAIRTHARRRRRRFARMSGLRDDTARSAEDHRGGRKHTRAQPGVPNPSKGFWKRDRLLTGGQALADIGHVRGRGDSRI